MNIIKRSNQVFPNGSNFQINGGQFISAQKVTYHRSYATVLDILYKHTAPGALLDSNERFDPPKCDQNTRVVVLQTMMEWIVEGDKSSSIMWLHGPAGAGKSALAQSIAEKCEEAGILAASFFFSRNALTSDRSDGRLLIATLVYQLASTFPRIRPYLRKYLKNNTNIFDRGIDAQAENLLILPVNKVRRSFGYFFASLFSKPHQPRLFIVDGLDECNDARVQCQILEALAKATRELGLPFRFLVASRPESHIRHSFEHGTFLRSIPVRQLNLAHDINADNDIRVYLVSEFKKIVETHPLKDYIYSTWPEPMAIETLVSRSSGQFVYASTVIKYIQSTKHRPTDRLRIILGITPTPVHETPYAVLDALYTHIFSSVNNPARVMHIFSLLAIPRRTDDGLGNFNSPDMIDQLLFFQPGDTQLILTDLLSIVALGDRYSPIRLHHASLNDFLLDPSRSGDMFVDLSKAHERLARGYLKIFQTEFLFIKNSVHQFDPHSYFASFRNNYDRASLSTEISDDLAKIDFWHIYQCLLSKFSANTPQYILEQQDAGDAITVKELWKARQLWRSRAMEQLLQPFKRSDLPKQGHILTAYLRILYGAYCPMDQMIKESLVSLFAQPRFHDYIFQVCDHVNHDSCQRCQSISPTVSLLSYHAMYAFTLHPSTEPPPSGMWAGAVAQNLGDRCAERAHICLIFLHGIIHAIVVSHRTAGTTSRNASREEIKARTRHDSYADYFFGAVLDCAIILLAYANHSQSLARVLEKFDDIDACNKDYVLGRFSLQFEQLKLQIADYSRRAEYDINSEQTLVGL